MKNCLIAGAIALIATPVFASDEESAAQFWQKEALRRGTIGVWGFGFLPNEEVFHTRKAKISTQRQKQIRQIVEQQARAQLGSQWVASAVRIAYVESRFNNNAVGPRTRHGRALGVMQVLPGSARALGYDARRLREPHYGVAAGVAHMKACIASGVRTEREMAACHVAGVKGWRTRLAYRHEKYKRQYVAMVHHARVY